MLRTPATHRPLDNDLDLCSDCCSSGSNCHAVCAQVNNLSDQEMVAYALEADVRLLPYLPDLLADLDELGSDAELITAAIGQLDLPAAPQVVDLGCGKGAVAVEIADTLGFAVTGIELFTPFLASCEALAVCRGVSRHCRFVPGNVRDLYQTLEPHDVAVFAALGDVLGPLDETIAIVRQYVKPGGYMVVSDPFVRPGGRVDFDGFEHYAERELTEQRLLACGDELVALHVEPFDDLLVEFAAEDDDESDEGELIGQRAREIVQRLGAEHADSAAVLAFAAAQVAENLFIEENLQDAIWVLRRSDS